MPCLLLSHHSHFCAFRFYYAFSTFMLVKYQSNMLAQKQLLPVAGHISIVWPPFVTDSLSCHLSHMAATCAQCLCISLRTPLAYEVESAHIKLQISSSGHLLIWVSCTVDLRLCMSWLAVYCSCSWWEHSTWHEPWYSDVHEGFRHSSLYLK